MKSEKKKMIQETEGWLKKAFRRKFWDLMSLVTVCIFLHRISGYKDLLKILINLF